MNDEAKAIKALGPVTQTARHVRPLGPRVLVRLIPGGDRSAGGLFLPPGAKDALTAAGYGEVVEVARTTPGGETERGLNVSGIPEGARVLFAKDKGLPVPWDEALRVLDVKDVVALVDEVEPH